MAFLADLPDIDALKTFLTEGAAPFIPEDDLPSDATLTRNLYEAFTEFQNRTGWTPLEAEATDEVRYFDPPRASVSGFVLDLEGGLVDDTATVTIYVDRAVTGSGRALTLHRDYSLIPFRTGAPYHQIRFTAHPGEGSQSVKIEGPFGFVAAGGQVPADMVGALLRLAAVKALKDQMGPGGIASEVRQGPVTLKFDQGGADSGGSTVQTLTSEAARVIRAYSVGY